MKDSMRERCQNVAKYVIDTNATVREAAKKFRISKSTIHKDLTERVCKVDTELAKEAEKVLAKNKAERHIRGGAATKAKYIRNSNS